MAESLGGSLLLPEKNKGATERLWKKIGHHIKRWS
jgi:hypothetical protein